MNFYPIYIDLKNRPVLIIGSGHMAESKINRLIDSGAQIKLISPKLNPNVRNMVSQGKISYMQKSFEENDLKGVWLVFCASKSKELNYKVALSAKKRGIYCNIIDHKYFSSFILPTVIQQGDITIGISTNGSSPALGQVIKEKISSFIGPEFGQLSALLGKFRSRILREVLEWRQRRQLFYSIANNKEILDSLRLGEQKKAERIVKEMIECIVQKQLDFQTNRSEGHDTFCPKESHHAE